MSDYEQSRYSTYPRASLDSGGSGFFWAMLAAAALGLLIVVIAVGNGSTAVDHPGGAGADPIVVPTESDPAATGTATGTE